MKYQDIFLNTDGGARGNPGPAGIGAVLFDQNKTIIFEISKYIGETTNNVAEYTALIESLKKIIQMKITFRHLVCRLDSQLVVRQLNGIYNVKKPHLYKLVIIAKKHLKQLNEISMQPVEITYIPRIKNKSADLLVNQAIDLV